LKIGDLVCWHVTLDHVALKSEIEKIAVGEFCTVYIYIYIYIYIYMEGSSCGLI